MTRVMARQNHSGLPPVRLHWRYPRPSRGRWTRWKLKRMRNGKGSLSPD